MTKKVLLYFVFVALFILQKPIFMLYHLDMYSAYPMIEWLRVMWHGVPHDLACAGYIMALPFLAQFPYIWRPGNWHSRFMRNYLSLAVLPFLLIFIVDLELYTAWGFKLDSTPLIYLFTTPMLVVLSTPVWAFFAVPVLIALIYWLIKKPFKRIYPNSDRTLYIDEDSHREKCVSTMVCAVLCVLLFIAMRGGVGASVIDMGRVYYSQDMLLNHAATNPSFSFFSTLKQKELSEQYRFMDDAEAQEAMLDLLRIGRESAMNDTIEVDTQLLNTVRPNILFIIFESFTGSACTALNPDADPAIMPNIARMYDEGIGFTNFYANSIRTDRGVAAILASYPGQPTYSVMKDQARCNNLQYLSQRLGENGYDTQFVQGGDNNFTNRRGFLTAGKVQEIISQEQFTKEERCSKWGVPDHLMFNYMYDQITNVPEDAAPYFKVFLTLSSHEPFEVPYHHLDDLYTNSVAYTDSCLGSFIDRLKATPQWDNLLIVGLADHCYGRYPWNVENHETRHFQIPMFWTGGAIKGHRLINTIGSQTDLAATLLSQMGLDHEDFNFSKDMMDRSIPHYAFYSFPDGFGFLTDSCRYIQDNYYDGVALSGSNDPAGNAERWGKAYLQLLYDDLANRDKY